VGAINKQYLRLRNEQKEMKDEKFRMKSKSQAKTKSQDSRDRLDPTNKEMDLKLQTLDYIFSGTKEYPEEFHQLYVQPLMDSGLTLEDSISLLVDGVLRPN
jgi:hypothetical protein